MSSDNRCRFRIFSGPNGSGKSSLYESLRKNKVIHTEIYVSADRIEKDLKLKKKFVFNAYRVKTNSHDFKEHIQSSGLLKHIKNQSDMLNLKIESGVITVPKKLINSYTASFITTYLVEKLIESKQSFCLETVMSHPSKIKLLEDAKAIGYKTYLYYIFTKNSNLNVLRVSERVRSGGHDVPTEKIKSRYKNCFKVLPKALPFVDKAYLFDNSGESPILVGQGKGANVKLITGYKFNLLKIK